MKIKKFPFILLFSLGLTTILSPAFASSYYVDRILPKNFDPEVRSLLKKVDSSDWKKAATELNNLGERAWSAIKFMIVALDDDKLQMGIRYDIAGDIWKIKGLSWLIDTLKSSDPFLRKAAVKVLGWLIRRQESMMAPPTYGIGLPLVSRIDDEIVNKTYETQIRGLLLGCIKDEDASVRQAVSETFGRIGDPRAVEALTVLSKDKLPAVRYSAAKAFVSLRGISPLSPEATLTTDSLLTLLADPDPEVRSAAISSLGLQQTKEEMRVVNALLNALQNDDPQLQKAVEDALAAIARRGFPVFGRASEYYWEYEMNKIEDEGTSYILDFMVKVLSDNHQYMRKAAARVLGETFKYAMDRKNPNFPYIQRDKSFRDFLRKALQGEKQLITLLNDPSFEVRQASAEALKVLTGKEYKY